MSADTQAKTKATAGTKRATKPRKTSGKKAAGAAPEVISLPEITFHELRVRIVGTTPLVMHRKGAKMARMLCELQGILPKPTGKKPKDPVACFLDSIYRVDVRDQIVAVNEDGDEVDTAWFVENFVTEDGLEDGGIYPVFAVFEDEKKNHGWGFPSAAFRDSFARAAQILKLGTMVGMRCTVAPPLSFLQIEGVPQLRFDFAVVQNKADLRFRAHFQEWETDLVLCYDPNVITDQTVLNILRYAGQAVGIGEMRPEKKVGAYGQFGFDPNKISLRKQTFGNDNIQY